MVRTQQGRGALGVLRQCNRAKPCKLEEGLMSFAMLEPMHYTIFPHMGRAMWSPGSTWA